MNTDVVLLGPFARAHSKGSRCGRDQETLVGSHEFKEKTFQNGKSVLWSWSLLSRACD